MDASVVDLGAVAGAGGVVWSAAPAGVHVNLVVLDPGQSIGEHRNDAVDVLVVVLEGTGTATVDGIEVTLGPSSALSIPRGTTRALHATTRLRYLTVHAERQPLTIGTPMGGNR